MKWFNEEEREWVENSLGLSEQGAVGTCIVSGAFAAPSWVAITGAGAELSAIALVFQSFLMPLALGLWFVGRGEGGLVRWFAALRANPPVLAIVAGPALLLSALRPMS